MTKLSLLLFLTILGFTNLALGADVPELIYYKFDGSSTDVPNQASSPVGNSSATIMGGLSQGDAGQFGGALVGTGGSSSTNYVNTGWNGNLGTGSWTISFWSGNFNTGTDLSYVFGESSTSFRCFTGGVAGANNWILRGNSITDVLVTGAATIAPHVIHFVYDASAANIKGYVDGVLQTTISQGAINISGSGSFIVGGYSSSTGINGKIDEFRFYNRALDATEIAETWNQELGLTPAVPVSLWSVAIGLFLIASLTFIRGKKRIAY